MRGRQSSSSGAGWRTRIEPIVLVLGAGARRHHGLHALHGSTGGGPSTRPENGELTRRMAGLTKGGSHERWQEDESTCPVANSRSLPADTKPPNGCPHPNPFFEEHGVHEVAWAAALNEDKRRELRESPAVGRLAGTGHAALISRSSWLRIPPPPGTNAYLIT